MADMPVIMATAKDHSDDVVEALKLGANDYVTKPLDFPIVLTRIQTPLSLKRAMDEIQKLAQQFELRNQLIRAPFGRYLTDEVVASLLDAPEGLRLGGEKRQVTILMSGLRGFTSPSGRLPPEQAVAILNREERCAPHIQSPRGAISKCGPWVLTEKRSLEISTAKSWEHQWMRGRLLLSVSRPSRQKRRRSCVVCY